MSELNRKAEDILTHSGTTQTRVRGTDVKVAVLLWEDYEELIAALEELMEEAASAPGFNHTRAIGRAHIALAKTKGGGSP